MSVFVVKGHTPPAVELELVQTPSQVTLVAQHGKDRAAVLAVTKEGVIELAWMGMAGPKYGFQMEGQFPKVRPDQRTDQQREVFKAYRRTLALVRELLDHGLEPDQLRRLRYELGVWEQRREGLDY